MKTVEAVVTERLRRLLLDGVFEPHHHLQEIVLAELLGASRTPVRGALATLAQEGLLTNRPKRGYFVRPIQLKEIMDAHRVRGQLEGLACRLLCEQEPDPDLLDRFATFVDVGERILAAGAAPEDYTATWWENNAQFHTTLVNATGNASLIDAVNRTLALPLVSSRVARWFTSEEVHISQYHHVVIVEAIAKRQAERAEAMMIEHVYIGGERIRCSFTASGRGQDSAFLATDGRDK
jgi:GntR family transcriptional regulator, vanillate catabolism transcriptional regulator